MSTKSVPLIQRSTPKLSHHDYTVGWICALPKEQAAAIVMLDELHENLPNPAGDHNTYTLGSIGSHSVVIACLPKGQMGNNSAAVVATRIVNTFPGVRTGLMVGIGGGIPPKVRLGDVVVGTPSAPLLTALSKLEARHLVEGSRIQHHLDVVERKGKKMALKFTRRGHLHDPLDDGKAEPLEEPRVHYGLIASGNQVIKDAKFRDSLNTSLGGEVLCVEMEAAGVANNFPCLAIRGICDYASEGKNKDWQEYAAGVAAAFAKELLEVVQPIELDRERPVKDVLDQVADAVLKTQNDVEHLKSFVEEQKTSDILNWLTPTDYNPQQADHLRRREPNTGQWLLRSTEYTHWMKTAGQILFFPGIPGAGKTIMAAIVIEDLHQRLRHEKEVGIVYIYCSYRRQKKQTLHDLLLNVLRQLLRQRHSAPHAVLEGYEEHRLRQEQPGLDEIIGDIDSLSALYGRLFIVVDALDECQTTNNCRTKFIDQLLNLQSRHNANIFATSRFIDDIMARFQRATLKEIRANPEDVGVFLAANMANLPAFVRRSEDLQESIKTAILEAIDGMFLLARLYIEFLEDKMTPRAMRNALDDLQGRAQGKSGEDRQLQLLSEAYDQAMERINGQREGYRKLARNALSWIVFSKEALPSSVLQDALALESDDTEFDPANRPEVGSILSVCAGLVAVDEESSVVRLVHYTTQEYFLKRAGDWFPDAESRIAKTCITYIRFTLLLDKGASIGARNKRGNTALSMAARGGQKDTARLLLARGADIEARNNRGDTPLSLAAKRGNRRTVQLLLEQGANIEARDNKGNTIYPFL
ncbi:purine and uridine phosphorylase [Aspergillus carlsbadensis]|nr:purine and uridine phosphorylase [Aspergillus carlsbadensis]